MECFNCGQSGHFAEQCRWAAEAAQQLPAQFRRCHRCSAVVYAWDSTIPCDHHRTVPEWREYYHSERFTADVAARMAAVPAKTGTEGKGSRVKAAEQVAESRANRPVL